jgi:1-deoxy-D-xylulose-5-phosphate synthase
MSTTEQILDYINDPSDLKELNMEQLDILASEIRDFLLHSVSRTGGHFASNLGTVELTLALHRVFDTPKDKIVWDVGHQAYPHKIITGRKDRMHTIRQFGGLSPFLRRDESEYDPFGVGHAGTAISAAYGMAMARDYKKEDNKVIAVVGDGALTAGMSFEALNHAGQSDRDFIIVLNDNKMSISKNVGALSSYFNRLITDQRYNRYKGAFEQLIKDVPLLLKELPVVKSSLHGLGMRVQESLKNLLVPDMLFEELGFRYFGPIDGHNMEELVPMFERIRDNVSEPVVVHVITVKGKGFEQSEKEQGEPLKDHKYHALSPKFDTETWQSPKKGGAPEYIRVFGDTLIEMAKEDERIVGITAAMAGGTGLSYFGEVYPDRCIDVGISEQHAITLAAGMATQGYKPVCAIYSSFMQRAFDQVLHDVCIQNLDVTMIVRGGLAGEDGETHQGVFDLGFMRMIPNLVVMEATNEDECRHMVATAVNHPGPVMVRHPKGRGQGVPMDGPLRQIPIGKGEVLREGDDVLLLAVGDMVAVAEKAADALLEKNISASVINARFVKPLDEALILKYLDRSPRLVTIEENVLAGGFGSAVLEFLQQQRIDDIPTRCIALPDLFIEHGSVSELRSKYGLTPEAVVEAALELVALSQKEKTSTV